MKKAIIFYQSKTGTTKKYAQEIGTYFQAKQIDTLCLPVEEYRESLLQNTDYLLLGCWTKGLMVIFQQPDNIWGDFAKKLIVPKSTKVALFATFKIRSGSMFKNMAKCVNHNGSLSFPNLKSRNGKLSEKDKIVLDEFINN
ncbi:MAG: flavodoxin domain-containing protein [Bacteroidales bacterium]|nr:flavodoxin domain-containing protein [Bacteroidales bacterium]